MTSQLHLDTTALPGLQWMPNGQSALSGPLLILFNRLDLMFLDWASRWQAQPYLFPTFIAARELNKLDYFRSFPHLVTFPVCLEHQDDNLKRFAEGDPLDSDGCVHLTKLAPVADVLTPAACYHFYAALQGMSFDAAQYMTTRATCFRRETHYLPLQRQWSFAMREVVCIGSSDEVKTFLQSFQVLLTDYFASSKLPVEFQIAADPFFNPSKNPKYLMQKLDPVKTEMIFDGHLAIGSLNFHRNYFGEAFALRRDGEDLFSGCVAFGLERWIYALLSTFGTDETRYPLI